MIQYDVSSGMCVLRLDCPPLNALNYPLLEDLCESLARANADEAVRGIVIIGDAKHFSAGADINLFEKLCGREDATGMSRVFQEAFGQVEDSLKPVVAALAGKVFGGALELAMACHFRVCTEEARFATPEVNLGINPGAGGTGRLPRLVGVGPALEMLLSGRMIDAARALELGLVDAISPGKRLLETALDMLRRGDAPRKTRTLEEKTGDVIINGTAFERAEQKLAAVRPDIIAPRNIIETVRIGLAESFAAGLLAEQESFAGCMETPATRNKIYLFFAMRQSGKPAHPSDTATRDISKVAVVGSGSMGTGIAHAMIIGGVATIVYDENPAAMEKAIVKIRRSIEKRVADGKLAESRGADMLSLLSTATGWQDLADADLVIEAVFEDVDIKQAVLRRIEAVCTPGTIIASNTSTISLDVLAEVLSAPRRLIGMHFFNPAQRMPLLEVIRRQQTSQQVVATVLRLAGHIRKTAVLVNNREGFLVNRLFIPYLKEAFWLLEEGAAAEDIDAAMVEFGFPMGPLVLIDMAGLDILAVTDAVLHRRFPYHQRLSDVATGLVEQGRLGQKTGGGVYDYQKGDYTPHHSPALDETVDRVRQDQGVTPRGIAKDEITHRLVMRMVAEAFRVLAEDIVQRESDIDVAMVLGTGFPDFRGGILRYARDMGLDRVLEQLRELEKQCGERFLPCGINLIGES